MSANIQVFYYTGPYTSTLLPTADALLARISPARRLRVAQRKDDAQRALDLASLRVLELGMRACGFDGFSLADVEYSATGGGSAKPRWTRGPADFSISHANSIAACAIASDCNVGLDAEDCRNIDPRIVRRLVGDDAAIMRGLDASNALLLWTQIESVLKGAGLGVMHARELQWHDDVVILRGKRWWLHKVNCGPAHVVHVAVDIPDAAVCAQCFTAL